MRRKRNSILVFFIFLYLNGMSAEKLPSCNCSKEFEFLQTFIEANYAGFTDKVNPANRLSYEKHTSNIMQLSKGITESRYCVGLMNKWLEFFRDGHIQIQLRKLPGADQQKVVSHMAAQTEMIALSDQQLDQLRNAGGIEGVYWSQDSVYKIALVKNKNAYRNFAGVILSSKNKFWTKGQVKLELKQGVGGTFEGILYDDKHNPENIAQAGAGNILGGWHPEGESWVIPERRQKDDVLARLLSDSVMYMKISTFNQRNAKNIDSMIRAKKKLLEKTPYLILDLRDNGGGSDFSYEPILPYINTGPIVNVGTDVYATDSNIKGWSMLLKMQDIPADEQVRIKAILRDMETNKGKFINIVEDETTTFERIEDFPKKVAVLINKGCGSTTEEFLLGVKQSSKVVLMGESTAGVLDYANMRTADFSGIPYTLYYATTRSRRIAMGLGIDNVGVLPDVKLDPDVNWVIAAQKYLEGIKNTAAQ